MVQNVNPYLNVLAVKGSNTINLVTHKKIMYTNEAEWGGTDMIFESHVSVQNNRC